MPSKNSESSSSTPPATQRRHPHLGIPLSLRRAPPQRKPSTPHLSVVFADPSLSHGGAAPSRPGTLASEDALARQMNAGGQEIGLRSRRSSSATVRTIRTLSGVGSPGVEEEGVAGPSTPRRTASSEIGDIPDEAVEAGLGPGGRLSDENMVETSHRLNPKHSTSWLRWNAPSGFPKSRAGSMVSRDKGKGKEREMGETAMVAPPATGGDLTLNGPSRNDVPLSDPPASLSPPDLPAVDPIAVLPHSSPPPTIRPAARTYRKNWWSRTASPAPSIRLPLPPDPKEHIAEEGTPAPPADPPLDPPPTNPDATQHGPATPATVGPPSHSPATQTIAALDLQPSIPSAGNGGGWKFYIWGNPSAPPLPPGEFTSDDNSAPLVSELIPANPAQSESPATAIPPPSELPLHPSVPSPKDTSSPQNAEAIPVGPTPLDAVNPTIQQGSGWGTFFYSLVVPQIAVARSLESASALANQPGAYPTEAAPPASTEISVNPAQDQRPEPAVKFTIPGLPNTPTTSSPLSTHSDALIVPSVPDSELPPGAALRKASTSSTTGWLSYLAYRSTQKKIGNGSIKSGRHSSELGEEEVMDFSVDPDFPSDPAVAEGKKADLAVVAGPGATSDKDRMPPPKTIPNKSSSANLAVRGKRQSVSSVRSAGMGGGTLTPLSSSPKTASMLDPKSTPTSSPRPASIVSSALPAPPLVPAQQPNLVIPTFDNTFSRPPRSFLPLPPPAPEPATETGSSGLAWRALSAAGSYVYTATAEKGKGKEKVGDEEEKKETRGRKEGRVVGADLPRRLGLGGGESDEGWKNVKRVVVVGVHGWFPAKMLNSVIGEPTGTSQKFANMMGAAVKQFFAEQGMEEDIRLTLMPLEGEGTIDARVDKLYKAYLSNPAWINDLRRADAIFFAAHSQGCIVTTHLLSRMIAQGQIRTPFNTDAVGRCEWAFGPIGVVPPDSRRRSPLSPLKASNSPLPGSEGGHQKVCMLAMCGVHLGPLYSISTSNVIQPYLQWFENAAARELFEFQESGSAVSMAYQKALGMVLDNGVKVVLLASLNDQVVPIYGSSFSTATHPLLLRALFVDGGSYSQTDFMTNLLCFAFMLRNAGLDDQRLIEHLSEATAGSLTGVGHSSPYEEPQSYALAVKYLFLSGPAIPSSPSTQSPSSPTSTNAPHIPPLRVEPFSARDTRNEFELPWIMRALVDSPQVKDLFPGELRELKEGVGAWRPVTKVLKEVKRRLEPMAGRQSRLRPIPNSPSSTSLNTMGSSGSTGKETTLGGLKRDW